MAEARQVPVEYRPTAIIGCGGSGNEIVRRVKRNLMQRYGEDIPGVHFLVIDCDERSFEKTPGLPDLDGAEELRIIPGRIGALVQRRRRPLEQWMDIEKVDISELEKSRGAGAKRLVGRAALFLEFARVREALQALRSRLANLDERVRVAMELGIGSESVSSQSMIYIVGSVCGGTGAGIFLDVALLVRHFIDDSMITGVFLLPTAFPDLRSDPAYPRFEANAFASIMELAFFRDEQKSRGRYSVRYDDVVVAVDRAVFDECYLVEGKNIHGDELTAKEQAFELVAQWLSQDIGSPIGQLARQAEPNIATVLEQQGMSTAPGGGRRAAGFAALGTSALVLQRDHLLAFAANRVANRVVENLRKNTIENAEDRARGFLQRLKLADPESWVRRMQQATASGRWPRLALPRPSLRLRISAFLARVNEYHKVRLPDAIAEAQTMAQENAEAVVGEFAGQLRSAVEKIIEANGVGGAERFLTKLLTKLQTISQALGKMADEWAGQAAGGSAQRPVVNRQNIESDLQKNIERLRRYGGIIDMLFYSHVDDRLKERIYKGVNELIDNELRFAAVSEAASAAEKLREHVQTLRDQCVEAMDRLRQVDEIMDNTAARLYAEVEPIMGGYSLQISVCDAQYYDWFLREHCIGQEREVAEAARPQTGWLELLAARPVPQIVEHFEQAGRRVLRPLEERISLPSVIYDMREIKRNRFDAYIATLIGVLLRAGAEWAYILDIPQHPVHSTIGLPISLSETERTNSERRFERDFREWLDKAVVSGRQRLNVTATGAKTALDLCVRRFGIAPGELEHIRDWRERYRELLQIPVASPHVDKRFPLPEMFDPIEAAEREQYPMFAIAIAYGVIARLGARGAWYIAVGEDEDGVLRPFYESTWPTLFEATDGEAGVPSLGHTEPQEAHLLGETRQQALENFLQTAHFAEVVEEWLDRYIGEVGSSQVAREIKTYVTKVLDPQIAANAPDKELLLLERKALVEYARTQDATVKIPQEPAGRRRAKARPSGKKKASSRRRSK